MKKQILILVFFAMAILASVTNSYGQYASKLSAAPTCATVIPIACNVAANPLNPIPGTPYDYEVNVSVPTGTPTFTYDWFVTTDKNFITTSALSADADAVPSAHIAAVGTGTGLSTYHLSGASTGKINITWQTFVADASNPVFLVIYVKNTATCATDNIQVFEIKPQPSFTLDLANITEAGEGAAAAYATCVSPVVSATWDQPTGKIIMNYGENYVYFTVTAANFKDSWKPAFQVSPSIALGTSVIDVAWAYPAESYAATPTWHNTTATGIDYVSADVVNAQTPLNGFIGIAGECIVVRVHITHNNEPTIADNTITLAVDGIQKDPDLGTYVTAALGDLHHATGANCGLVDGFTNDRITQVISARPNITAVAPSAPFILKTN